MLVNIPHRILFSGRGLRRLSVRVAQRHGIQRLITFRYLKLPGELFPLRAVQQLGDDPYPARPDAQRGRGQQHVLGGGGAVGLVELGLLVPRDHHHDRGPVEGLPVGVLQPLFYPRAVDVLIQVPHLNAHPVQQFLVLDHGKVPALPVHGAGGIAPGLDDGRQVGFLELVRLELSDAAPGFYGFERFGS